MGKLRISELAGADFAWSLCGNVTYSFCQWAFVVVLARAGSPRDVGEYAFGLAVCAPLLTFANCQGRNLVASDIRNTYSFRDYLGFRILSMTIAMIAVAGVGVWTRGTPAAVAVICSLGVSQALDWVSETYFGLMQKNDHLDWVGQSLMLKGPLCLLLFIVAMYLTHNLLWAASALVIGRALTLCFFDVRRAARLETPINDAWTWKTMRPLIKSALPLGLISVIGAFNLNIPRYFIEFNLSTRELGIFSAAASLVGAGNLVMSALGNTSFVGIARAVATHDRPRYRQLSTRLLVTAAALGLVGFGASHVAGREILVRLFHPEYGASSGALTRLMVAGGISYVISGQGYALTAARVFTPQILILLCAAAATVVLCWWLVPMRGIQGAAEASVAASALTLVVSSFILARVEIQNPNFDVSVGAAQTAPSQAA